MPLTSNDHTALRGSDTNGSGDPRMERLREWLVWLTDKPAPEVTTASADASFRRYFRVTLDGQTRIVMDAPPDKEDVGPFIRIAAMLAAIGVNAPRVLEQNLEEGFLLLTDLGNLTYLKELELGRNVEPLYQDAIAALVRIQANGAPHQVSLPAYDHALLMREMQLFPDWFLGKHLGLEQGVAATDELQQTFARLSEAALEQPRVFVHRDYHSRNLMICREARYGDNPGILDFQDAVAGPITYDLVSLLRDCYVAWPDDEVQRRVETHRRLAQQAGLDAGADSATFQRWFDWMGVQRHLKAIGIFARLWHRDGKAGYLSDIPRTLHYVRAVSGRYPQLQPLVTLIDDSIAPALARTRA